jgi:transcriptional regulator with XRE-family HTH domain
LPVTDRAGYDQFGRDRAGRLASAGGEMAETTLREAIGAVLREERQRRELVLRALAARAGVAPAYLGEVERGLKEPSSETLGRLAAALDLPLADLLRRAADSLDGGRPRPGRLELEGALVGLVGELSDDDLATLVSLAEFLRARGRGTEVD